MGRHISDTRTMWWEIHYISHRVDVQLTALKHQRQAAADYCSRQQLPISSFGAENNFFL